mmetsp:Transcript_104336/g.189934  ORF Transcript_104336/g.189934 Transcript_104336/m.189934 type:complete len:245 (-) Transcript_104336:77-811(-)
MACRSHSRFACSPAALSDVPELLKMYQEEQKWFLFDGNLEDYLRNYISLGALHICKTVTITDNHSRDEQIAFAAVLMRPCDVPPPINSMMQELEWGFTEYLFVAKVVVRPAFRGNFHLQGTAGQYFLQIAKEHGALGFRWGVKIDNKRCKSMVERNLPVLQCVGQVAEWECYEALIIPGLRQFFWIWFSISQTWRQIRSTRSSCDETSNSADSRSDFWQQIRRTGGLEAANSEDSRSDWYRSRL